jgi:hypothetical protein
MQPKKGLQTNVAQKRSFNWLTAEVELASGANTGGSGL